MARARLIKPGFFANEHLAELNPFARLLFAGLWTIADREGRLEDRPKRIKAELFPYDAIDVDAALAALAGAGFIQRYRVSGAAYIQVVAFTKHQSPHVREQPSEIPAPDEHSASPVPAPAEHGTSPAVPIADPVSVSVPVPVAVSGADAPGAPAVADAAPVSKPKRQPTVGPSRMVPLTEERLEELRQYAKERGHPDFDKALARCRASPRFRYGDRPAILREWIDDDIAAEEAKRGRTNGTQGTSRASSRGGGPEVIDQWDRFAAERGYDKPAGSFRASAG